MNELVLLVIGAVLGRVTEEAIAMYKQHRRDRAIFAFARKDDVLQWGWSADSLLKKLIALDREVTKDQLTDEREGTVAQWAPVFWKHPETWVLLTKGRKNIVGYWHFAAINDQYLARIHEGKMQDSEITSGLVEDLDYPGTYNLYFIMIARLPQYKEAGPELRKEFIARLASLASNGVYFRSISANAISESGRRLCESFYMTKLCEDQFGGVVYSLCMDPWPVNLNAIEGFQALSVAYQRKFQQ